MNTQFLALALAAVCVASAEAKDPQFELLVAGGGSDNVVRFDLATGADRVLAKLANGSQPRSLAVNDEGRLFVGLRGNAKTVVELTPHPPRKHDSVLVATDVTSSIGRFGPGSLAFDKQGLLHIAGDTERSVLRYNVNSRELVDVIKAGRSANVVGLTIHEDSLFVAEYFQRTVLKIGLTADPRETDKLVYQSSLLDHPCGMAVGHNGHLFVASLENDLVQEFDADTGSFIRTFLDVKTVGASHVHDLHYQPQLNRYFLSSGSAVYELASDGSLLSRYQSPALVDAQGVVCRRVRKD